MEPRPNHGPIISIGNYAFQYCYSLTNLVIPNTFVSIGDGAFRNCISLTGVDFRGNAPSIGLDVFGVHENETVYYLPSTTGWSTTFGGLPTILWNLQVQNDARFGMRTNQFGFTITGTTNIPIVVEACPNLPSSVWLPIQSCTLTNGSLYFSDPQWTNYPSHFYRLGWP